MSLKDLLETSRTIEDALADSNGELTPEIESMLAIVDVQLPQKIDNYSFLIERMKSSQEFYAERSEFYYKFSKSCENVIKKLKDNVKFGMINMGLDELLGNEIKFKLRNNKASLFVKDESLIPDKYKIVVTSYKLDNAKIIEDLKNGIEVPGVELLHSKSVMVYPNKK